MSPRMLWVSALLGLSFGVVGCGTVGPTQRPQRPRSTQAAEPRCQPDLTLECESVCMSGDWAACETAGIGYLSGENVTQDLRRANILLRRSCEQDRPLACSAYAKMSLDQQGVTLAAADVWRYLEQGCTEGDFNACTRLGNQVFAESPSRQNLERATGLWDRACTGGDPHACYQLGLNAKTGRGGAPRDPSRAVSLLDRACSAGVPDACFELAQLQLAPSTPVSDAGRGMSHLQRGCGLGSQAACAQLADSYQFGKGLPKDVGKARSLHEQACKGGQVASCVALAALSPDSPDVQLQLYTKGCDAQIAAACYEQARLLAAKPSPGPSPDERAALEQAYRRACDKGIPKACGALGLIASASPSLKVRAGAVSLLESGCNTGEMPETCLKLGRWFATGEPVARDGKRAASLLGPLCSQGSGTDAAAGQACYDLGRVTQFGYGVPANALGAASLFESGCARGDQAACLAHAEQRWLGIGGVKKTPQLAVEVFRKQCEAQVSDACLDLGYALQQGVGVARDLERARSLFDAECKAGRQNGCAHLGNLLALSKGTDRERGQALLASACDAASGRGCWFLSELPYVSKEQRGELLKRACTLEVPEACSVQRLSERR